MDVRRVAFGWGTQMAYSSTTSVPRPSVHPRAMLLSHYISCRCPLKQPVLFRERGFLIAFPCRCFFFRGCRSPGRGESAPRRAVQAHQCSQAPPGEVRQSGEVLEVQTAL